MEFYNGELKKECLLEEIASDGNKWFWVCVGSTFALYGLLGCLGDFFTKKYEKKEEAVKRTAAKSININ